MVTSNGYPLINLSSNWFLRSLASILNIQKINFLESIYEWDHAVLMFLCLGCFILHDDCCSIHDITHRRFIFLWLYSILLNVTFKRSMYQMRGTQVVSILASMTSTLTKVGEWMFVWDRCPIVGLLDHIVVAFYFFEVPRRGFVEVSCNVETEPHWWTFCVFLH